ncbi:LppU/SCO3897 family protein [Amycolatopsis anabasis]|uniref:LppU/SCO3897 family protein n=1 Tax=Amycolatopsis anabasis TaxID=1840409 RepID=UPI00131AC685|nr:hypothetical protein [Amycolatopsis anabasis]
MTRDRRRLSRRTSWIAGAAVAVVAVGAFAWTQFGPGGLRSDLGACVRVEGETLVNQAIVKVDCGSPQAGLRIAAVSESGCPEGDYSSVLQQTGETPNVTSTWTCLVLNGDVGDCFPHPSERAEKFRKLACTDPAAYRITRKFDGHFEETGRTRRGGGVCGEEVTESYRDPPVTYCLAPID